MEKLVHDRKRRKSPVRGVIIKNEAQIAGIRKACKATKEILDGIGEHIKPGITTEAINTIVHDHTLRLDAIPAPLNYRGFPKSVCTSINEVVCHGIPSPNAILAEGDIINVDVTCIVEGYYGDASRMFTVGKVSDEAQKLVTVAAECLQIGIEQVQPGKDFGEIGFHIEKHAQENGYSVVRDFGGHGIGLGFHEEPHVFHFGSRRRGIRMKPGMVFTIEPMINVGVYNVKILSDGWTVLTTDKKLSAQWEHTVAVTNGGCEVLTG
ncbi:MAG: type I methionyl aminopeptidase [Deltaproteobacteria bacterium CG2_30_63_29]|nr:MAG: type I methionyl aminopeptidase [Deltaproteobacteria bacterium CG2_30_63_29]